MAPKHRQKAEKSPPPHVTLGREQPVWPQKLFWLLHAIMAKPGLAAFPNGTVEVGGTRVWGRCHLVGSSMGWAFLHFAKYVSPGSLRKTCESLS